MPKVIKICHKKFCGCCPSCTKFVKDLNLTKENGCSRGTFDYFCIIFLWQLGLYHNLTIIKLQLPNSLTCPVYAVEKDHY